MGFGVQELCGTTADVPRNRFMEIDIDRVLAKSKRAYLVVTEGEEVWLPVSQLEDVNIDALQEAYEEREALVCFQIPAWLGERIGLEGVQ